MSQISTYYVSVGKILVNSDFYVYSSPTMFPLHKSQYRPSLGKFEYRPLSVGSLWLQLLSLGLVHRNTLVDLLSNLQIYGPVLYPCKENICC